MKGFKKRSLEVKCKILEVEYKAGELTARGYETKKRRLVDELEMADLGDQSDASTGAYRLKEAGSSSKLSDSINKLFGKCSTPNTSKVKSITRIAKERSLSQLTARDPSIQKGKRKASIIIADNVDKEPVRKKKPVEKPIVVEVICMPNMAVTIPRGHYKNKLEDAGRVKYLKYTRSDSDQEIKARIIDLFPSVFRNGITEFKFLDARCRYLEKITVPPSPHCEWSGAAVMTLTGQGRLFILPVEDNGQQETGQQKTQQASNVPCTIASSSICSLTMNMCSNNSFSAVGSSVPHCGRSIDIESAKDVDDSKHADDSHEESPLPFIIKEQIENKCIGNAILEYADKRAPYYPNYPNDLQPGETELYKINWRIDLWITWRISVGKKPLKESSDKYFYIVSDEEFEEYSKFCDSLKFLPFISQNSYIIRQTDLVNYYMTSMKVQMAAVEMYGARFYELSEHKLIAFANWIEIQLKKLHNY